MLLLNVSNKAQAQESFYCLNDKRIDTLMRRGGQNLSYIIS